MIAVPFFCSRSCMQERKNQNSWWLVFYAWDWLQMFPQPSVGAFRLHKTNEFANWRYQAFSADGINHTVVFLSSADRSGEALHWLTYHCWKFGVWKILSFRVEQKLYDDAIFLFLVCIYTHIYAVAITEEKEESSHNHSRWTRPIEIHKPGYAATFIVQITSTESKE